MYRNDYAEYSRDKSVPLKEKAPILAEFAKLISTTQQRINVLEERIAEINKKKEKESEERKKKLIEKERELEKKHAESKNIPEQAPPPEETKENLPVVTSKLIVPDKVILVIKIDPTKINYFGSSGEINWRVIFDRFPGIATVEFNKVFAGSGLKFPIQIQTCMKVNYYRERNG
jgi:hypothetical protein